MIRANVVSWMKETSKETVIQNGPDIGNGSHYDVI